MRGTSMRNCSAFDNGINFYKSVSFCHIHFNRDPVADIDWAIRR